MHFHLEVNLIEFIGPSEQTFLRLWVFHERAINLAAEVGYAVSVLQFACEKQQYSTAVGTGKEREKVNAEGQKKLQVGGKWSILQCWASFWGSDVSEQICKFVCANMRISVSARGFIHL